VLQLTLMAVGKLKLKNLFYPVSCGASFSPVWTPLTTTSAASSSHHI